MHTIKHYTYVRRFRDVSKRFFFLNETNRPKENAVLSGFVGGFSAFDKFYRKRTAREAGTGMVEGRREWAKEGSERNNEGMESSVWR